MSKEEIKAFALTKALEFTSKPEYQGSDENDILIVANRFYDFLTFNEDKFGLKENARQKAQEERAKEIMEILNKLKYK